MQKGVILEMVSAMLDYRSFVYLHAASVTCRKSLLASCPTSAAIRGNARSVRYMGCWWWDSTPPSNPFPSTHPSTPPSHPSQPPLPPLPAPLPAIPSQIDLWLRFRGHPGDVAKFFSAVRVVDDQSIVADRAAAIRFDARGMMQHPTLSQPISPSHSGGGGGCGGCGGGWWPEVVVGGW